ncbi:glycosyltransferase [Pseudoflavitalea sp. X16]|uniref:glycosyltransferase family 2 protein n=1 Tax=Paraflavitalea devenefica TaxID=2716334 RepID=UPI0014228A55|nr:glycosyltransferase [Paraflavitalea devenefica]NII24096.1 glycosyltransferase [Paraflavitalea devenefica]
MENNPLVSIITPSFNRADIVSETALSIFRQSYVYWEWIIVDDGSTDNSWDVLQQFAARDSKVKVFQRDREPKGACSCRNIAVERSSGEYLLFLDTDDLLAPYCLEQRIKAAKEYQVFDFLIFPMLLFKQHPADLRLLWNIDKEVDEVDRLLFGDPVCQGTGTLWKKDSFVKMGMWDESLLLWQDIELHLRAFTRGLNYVKCLHLKPDVFLRISDVSLSRTGYHSIPKLRSRLQVFMNTANTLFEKNSIGTYRQGLRYLFIDLFLNAMRVNYFILADELFSVSNKYNLFSVREDRVFKKCMFLYRLKLYKMPGVQGRLLNRVMQLEKAREITLGKQIYSEGIVCER